MAVCHEEEQESAGAEGAFTVALAGTPNSGKTTLFNHMTRLRRKVANYPGVTVEKRSGTVVHDGIKIEVVDLPGMYGFGSESLDEVVARKFCLQERPDVIVTVLDASNLERGLYLAVQWLELGFPIIIVLNMMDEAEKLGIDIDAGKLSDSLGVPVVSTVATKGEGVAPLLEAIAGQARHSRDHAIAFEVAMDPPIDTEIARVVDILSRTDGVASDYPLHWLAAKLVEGDEPVVRELGLVDDKNSELAQQVEAGRERLRELYGQPPPMVLSSRRHDYARDLWAEVVKEAPEKIERRSDRVDRILTNPYVGLPLFLFATYLIFEFAFTFGQPPMDWIEWGVESLSGLAMTWLPDGAIRSLVVDGILGGVGGVIVFLPNIVLLFIAMAVLEDTGYMARGAAIMDRMMSRFGLHGKSFIPLMVGFGCNVPAIMAARTLENSRDRLVTILVTPMMSCGARLPVYVLFISAFFPAKGALVLFSLYMLGILMAVGSALVFRRTLFRGRRTPFVLEMPPYRVPALRSVLTHAWDRSWMYLKKAGTVILLLAIVVWFLSSYPKPPKGANVAEGDAMRYSVAGSLGSLFEPVLRPAGLGDWKVGVALISGFAAKEVVVSSFATLYNVSESSETSEALREALQEDPVWNPLSAYALMVFVLLYVPCLPAMVVLRRETGSWKWVALQIAYTTALAYSAAFVVFQGGRLLGFGA